MVERIGLEAVLETAGFNRGVREYLGGLDRMEGQTDRAGRSLATSFQNLGGSVLGLGAKMAQVAATAAVALAGGIAAIGTASLKAAIDFESGFAGVIKTTEGLVDEFGNLTGAGEELQQGFRDLAKEVPIALEELLIIGELGGQLGIAREDLLEFSETVAALGVTTNLTTEESAAGFARLATIMGTLEVEGATAFSRLGSSIVALGNNFATTEQQVLNFGLRIAGAGEIAGLTEADVLAIGAAMASVGVEAEAGGTAVQKVLLAMNEAATGTTGALVDNTEAISEVRDEMRKLEQSLYLAQLRQAEFTDKTKESTRVAAQFRIDELTRQYNEQKYALEALMVEHGKWAVAGNELSKFAEVSGLSAKEFKQLWQKDASQAFTRFVEGLGRAGDDAIKVLDELGLKDQRLVRAFLSLAGAGDLLTDTINVSSLAWDENTALATEAELRYRTTESQIRLVKNIIEDLGISIGQALLPVFGDLLEAFGGLITEQGPQITGFFEDLATWLSERLPSALETLAGFWNTILGPAITGVWDFLQTNLFPVFETLWNWLSVVLPQAISWVVENWDAFRAALVTLIAILTAAALLKAIGAIVAALDPLILAILAVAAIVAVLAAAWQRDWGGIRTFFTNLWETKLKAIFDNLVLFLKEFIPKAMEFLKGAWENTLRPALEDVWLFIRENVLPLFADLIVWLAENIPVAIGAAVDFLTNWLIPAFQDVWDFIETNILPIFAEIVEWLFTNIPVAIQAAADFWENTLKPALEDIWDFISENVIPVFETLVEWLGTNIPPVIETLADLWENTLKPAIEIVWEFLQESIFPLMEGLAELFGAVVGKAIEALAGLWENVLQPALETVWGFIKEHLSPIFETIGELLSDIGETIRDDVAPVIGEFTDKVLEAMRDAFEGISKRLKPVIDFIRELADKISALELPDWLSPGSATPFEEALIAIAKLLGKDAPKALDLFLKAFQAAADIWEQDVESLIDQLEALYQIHFPLLRDTAVFEIELIALAVQNLTSDLNALAVDTLDALQAAFVAAFGAIADAIEPVATDIGDLADDLQNLADTTLPALKAAFLSAFSAADGAQKVVGDTITKVASLTTGLGSAETAVNDLATAFADGAASLKTKALGALNDIIGRLTSIDGLIAAINSVRTAVGSLGVDFGTLQTGAVNALNAIINSFSNVDTGLLGAINTVRTALTSTSTGIIGALNDLVDATVDLRLTWYDAWVSATESIEAGIAIVNDALQATLGLLGDISGMSLAAAAVIERHLKGPIAMGGGPLAMAGGISRTVQTTTNNVYNFGGNTFQSEMDLVAFENRVVDTVTRRIREGR